MRKSEKTILFILAFFITIILYAQEKQGIPESVFEKISEDLSENSEDIDIDEIYEKLYHFYSDPIALNSARMNDLRQLFFLNEIQILNLIEYRNKYYINSFYEIQYIDGFDNETARLLSYFTSTTATVEKQSLRLRNLIKYGNHEIIVRNKQILEQQAGYINVSDSVFADNPNSVYKGNKQNIYTKYKFKYSNKLNIGFTTEKDAGETLSFSENKAAFDYFSSYISFSDLGRVKSFVIGSYHAQFGQGLNLWTGFKPYKNPASPLSVFRYGAGIKPYSSSSEYGYFRGIAGTYALGNFEFSPFFSKKAIDASVDYSDSTDEQLVSSILETGLHRTVSEIANKNSSNERVFGGHAIYKNKHFDFSIIYTNYHYSNSIKQKPEAYSQFRFNGNSSSNYGYNLRIPLGQSLIFSEASINENNAKAILIGSLMNITSSMNISILYRNYDTDFYAIHGQAFGENTLNANEEGIYTGIDFSPFKSIKLLAYADLYKFQYLKYLVNSPSFGYEYSLQAGFSINPVFSFYSRIRYENNPLKIENDNPNIAITENYKKIRIRVHFDYNISEQIALSSRYEWVNYQSQNTTDGFLLYQDLKFKPDKIPLRFDFRFAIFHTDDWNSRIYAYEKDMLYQFSVPAYYDKGTRTYFNISYKISQSLSFYARYSLTHYSEKQIIGTALDAIEGNKKSELKLMIRCKI